MLEALGIGRAEADEKFGFLIEALQHGAPPHGGIALRARPHGRAAAGRESIRDVIAFPKTASGADLMTGAPAPIERGSCASSASRPARPALDASARPGQGVRPGNKNPNEGMGLCRISRRDRFDNRTAMVGLYPTKRRSMS